MLLINVELGTAINSNYRVLACQLHITGSFTLVEAQGASNYSRRIFDAFQSHERNEISPTVFAGIDLQPPETVLAEAAFDDPAPVASWAEIRFGLDGWTEAPSSFH
jgi:hypothetical protein